MKHKILNNILIITIFFTLTLFPLNSETISFSARSSSTKIRKSASITVLEGDACITMESFNIRADRIELSGENYQIIQASGSVSGEDKKNNIRFLAHVLTYNRKTERIEIKGAAEFFDTKNNMHIKAGRVVFNQKEDTVLLQMGVEIIQEDTHIVSLFAFYRRADETLDLTGHPVVKKNNDTFTAHRISINLKTDTVLLHGNVSGTVIQEENSSSQLEIPKNEHKHVDTKKTIEAKNE